MDIKYKNKSELIRDAKLKEVSKYEFYNLSKFTFKTLLDDPANIAQHLTSYINNYSKNIRDIMERFDFETQIKRMDAKNKLFEVVKRFSQLDLSSDDVDTMQMGYIFERSIRISAEQSNEEAGEHFTPREVIRLMVNLLLVREKDLSTSGIVKRIYDPACGTGGMLLITNNYILELNAEADPYIYGQEVNDESWAVCASNLLISGQSMNAVNLGDTLTNDASQDDPEGGKFHYMLANPPFGVEWKEQQNAIKWEHESLGDAGRFGAGLPHVSDGSLLFLQHMLSKMRPKEKGGSRIAIVFNASPLFSGDASSGPSNIRRWIIENDWLEAIVALPDQLFYNTSIATYIWILTNHKEERRRGRVQLVDARKLCFRLSPGIGNKRKKLGDPRESSSEPDHIGDITRVYDNFIDKERHEFDEEDPVSGISVKRNLLVSRILDNTAFGYRKITVEHPKKTTMDGKKLKDVERVPLGDDVDAFMDREVLPHWPDARVDHAKTKIGYEIPFDIHFFEPHPPRDLKLINADIAQVLQELTQAMIEDVTSN